MSLEVQFYLQGGVLIRHPSLIPLKKQKNKKELVKCKKEIMLKNRNQISGYYFFLLRKVQDRPLNKCNFIFLLITLHTFIKTTTDYNLTICVKKGTATNLQTQIEAVFSANCTFFLGLSRQLPSKH